MDGVGDEAGGLLVLMPITVSAPRLLDSQRGERRPGFCCPALMPFTPEPSMQPDVTGVRRPERHQGFALGFITACVASARGRADRMAVQPFRDTASHGSRFRIRSPAAAIELDDTGPLVEVGTPIIDVPMRCPGRLVIDISHNLRWDRPRFDQRIQLNITPAGGPHFGRLGPCRDPLSPCRHLTASQFVAIGASIIGSGALGLRRGHVPSLGAEREAIAVWDDRRRRVGRVLSAPSRAVRANSADSPGDPAGSKSDMSAPIVPLTPIASCPNLLALSSLLAMARPDEIAMPFCSTSSSWPSPMHTRVDGIVATLATWRGAVTSTDRLQPIGFLQGADRRGNGACLAQARQPPIPSNFASIDRGRASLQDPRASVAACWSILGKAASPSTRTNIGLTYDSTRSRAEPSALPETS